MALTYPVGATFSFCPYRTLQYEPGRDIELSPEAELEPTEESQLVLDEARGAYDALGPFRERRRRARNYYFGDQWSETITDDSGSTVTEEAYLQSKGRIAWRANQIAPAVRNLKGSLRQNRSERQAFGVDREDDGAAEMMTQALRSVRRINRSATLEAFGFQDFLLSGAACFRVGYKYWNKLGREDVIQQSVPMHRVFWNPDASDPRLFDLRLIGCVHDMTLDEVLMTFGRGDAAREAAIERIFTTADRRRIGRASQTGFDLADTESLYGVSVFGKCRVIEAWTLSARVRLYGYDEQTGAYGRLSGVTEAGIEHENEARAALGMAPLAVERRMEQVWTGHFLSPSGHVLWSGETPYAHGGPPFVLGFADLVDGEPKGLVDDLIDQQRLYNRQIAVLDGILATSAKGVLMIPEEMLPEGVTPEQFADSYTRLNGVIVYRAKGPDGTMTLPSGVKPEQVFNNSLPAGAFEWLATMRDNLEYASGVRGANLGQSAPAGTSGALYAQQVAQGSLTNVDLFEGYFELVRELDTATCRVIAQHYTEERPLRTSDGRLVVFDPAKVQDLDFDIALGNVQDTATARMLFEEDLKAFLRENRITMGQYLELSGHPKAQALQALIQRTNPALSPDARGTTGGPPDPALMQAVQAQLMMGAEAGDADSAALLAQAQ